MKFTLLDDDLDDERAKRRDAFDVGLAIGLFAGGFIVAFIFFVLGAPVA